MGNAIDSHDLPSSADQLRIEFLFDQPLAGLLFERLGKPLVFELGTVALGGKPLAVGPF